MTESYNRNRKITYVVQGQAVQKQSRQGQAQGQRQGKHVQKKQRHHSIGGQGHSYIHTDSQNTQFKTNPAQKRHPVTTMKENRNNVVFKNIKRQLRLNNKELSERMGVSKSMIDSWSRGLDSTKAVTGMYRVEGEERRLARHKHMNDEYFYRFIVTLTESDLDRLRFAKVEAPEQVLAK
jgi:DNA-binding transcriptional regulator YiaG